MDEVCCDDDDMRCLRTLLRIKLVELPLRTVLLFVTFPLSALSPVLPLDPFLWRVSAEAEPGGDDSTMMGVSC